MFQYKSLQGHSLTAGRGGGREGGGARDGGGPGGGLLTDDLADVTGEPGGSGVKGIYSL